MEHIDAITAVLRAIDAGQRPILLESWTGVKHELSPLTHAFIIAKLVHLEQVECAQPLPEWYGTFPEGAVLQSVAALNNVTYYAHKIK